MVENNNSVILTGLQMCGEGLAVTVPPPETGIMIVQSRNVVVESNTIYNTGLGFVRGGRSWGNRCVQGCHRRSPASQLAGAAALSGDQHNVVAGGGLVLRFR